MKNQQSCYPFFILAWILALLTFMTVVPWPHSVVAAGSHLDPKIYSEHQTAPTETPQTTQGEEILITNPALLKIMILLSVVAVLVIFWGAWTHRPKIDLR